MGLEQATFINGLVSTNPTATDSVAQADDHIRLIKTSIRNTFPFITNALSVTHDELNVLDANTSPIASTLTNTWRMIVNDGTDMKQINMSDLKTYLTGNLTITSAMIQNGTIQEADLADGSVSQAKLAPDAQGVPSGVVLAWTANTAPTGWLLCYGQEVSRTTYATLFSAIGTTYGSNDSTTFTLPDMRGLVIAGKDDMGGAAAGIMTDYGTTLGATGGSEHVTLTTNEMPAHSHSGNVALRTNWESGTSSQSPIGTGSARYDGSGTNPALTINDTGGGQAHENTQPTMILNYIIKT